MCSSADLSWKCFSTERKRSGGTCGFFLPLITRYFAKNDSPSVWSPVSLTSDAFPSSGQQAVRAPRIKRFVKRDLTPSLAWASASSHASTQTLGDAVRPDAFSRNRFSTSGGSLYDHSGYDTSTGTFTKIFNLDSKMQEASEELKTALKTTQCAIEPLVEQPRTGLRVVSRKPYTRSCDLEAKRRCADSTD
jgi:hypothetical protein